MSEHTKGELTKVIKNNKVYLECYTLGGYVRIAEITMAHRADSVRDTEYILKCWNCHDDLVAACKGLLNFVKRYGDDRHLFGESASNCSHCILIKQGKAALAKAKE